MKIIVEIKTSPDGENTMVEVTHEGEPLNRSEEIDSFVINEAIIHGMKAIGELAEHSTMGVECSEEFSNQVKRSAGF